MSTIDRVLSAVRGLLVMEQKIDALTDGVEKFSQRLLDHERRLVRLETIREIGNSSQLSALNDESDRPK